MIEGLKPYNEYKDSGSNWLASVPAHWEIRNLRTLITKRAERDRPELPLLSVAREKGVFVRSLTDEKENHNVIPEDLSNYKVARVGDLVINKMKAWQGSMGIAPCDGIVSPAYYVFSFRINNHAYGQALLRSKPYVAHFGQASDGVRIGQWDLSIPGMRQIPVLVPSEDEQAAIVRFLNHANSRIERAVRAKKKLITLLNEQKQAIIHRAVTRGLDPLCPLKPSGIPWIGDIPAHWKLSPNRALLRKRKVLVGDRHSEYRLLSLTKKGVIVRDIESGKGKFSSDMGTSQEVRVGDLVFCLFDVPETPRTVGLSKHNGMITGAYSVFECSDSVLAAYLDLFYRAMDDRKLLSPLYSGLRNTIPPSRFLGAKTPLPPSSEQFEIVKYLETATSDLDASINHIEREIDLLREYRARLAADVVTGKLDVREAASRLPDEAASDTDTSSDDVDDLEIAEEEAA